MIWMKLQEEDDRFINVPRPTLADTDGVVYLRKPFCDRIDFGGSKLKLAPIEWLTHSNTGWIQYTVANVSINYPQATFVLA
jgi:hypothetical protein